MVRHKKTGILRAMKSLSKKNVRKEKAEKLFEEVRILRSLDHPNIVKLFDLYEDNDFYFMVTE